MEIISENVATSTISELFERQKTRSLLLRTEAVANRKVRMLKLREWIHKNRQKIHEAMYADFQKAAQEVDAIELFHVLNEIKLAVDNLEKWTSPKKVDAPLTMLGTRSFIQYEPKGVCLIISPWNYPFCLAVGPMVSALAAGNTVILKPSEITVNVSALLKDMCDEVFEKEIACVVEGDARVSQFLLSLPFDHIFFTGSPAVGKVVMKAAAEHLTSVTLELGGKSPAIVAADAHINVAAERIAVGKFVNNGQTCVAPDYVMVDERVREKFTKTLIQKIKERFGGNDSFESSKSYCRIVNQKHFKRLCDLVDDSLEKGAKVEWGGKANEETRFFHPTILSDIPPDARIMQEEVFGPVLPVISYSKIEEAIDQVNRLPKALSIFIFSRSKRIRDTLLKNTSAGGGCINDCGIHFLHHNLPFGGISNSGIGKSHGHFGFLAFSNEKAIVKQRNGMTTFRLFYPPYTERSAKLMEWFLKLF